MDRAYAEPLCIPRLACIAKVSQAHFIRTFRDTFGETPHRYLQRRGVERAMFLPRATGRSVTDVLLRRRFRQPRHLQPHISRHRRRVAHQCSAEKTITRGPDLFHDGLDASEQFWRSGAEFTRNQQPYGIDIGVRDPFGNHIRIVQPKA